MRDLIIPITEDTLELITEANGGVTPQIEEETTFFVYKGPNTPAEIIGIFEFEDRYSEFGNSITLRAFIKK